MVYCLYLRKSRADLEAEAHGEGETLARHEKALRELAARQKLNITKIYREIVSGETIASRPVMQQLLNDVGEGAWDGVLVVEVERLARGDTIDQGIVAQTFKFSGTKIITPLKTYNPNNEYDEEYFEFGLFMSRREYKTINRRLQNGRAASVREGKYAANKAPYGYRRKKLDGEKGYTLVPDPDTAPIVQLIFSLYAWGNQQPDGTAEEMGTAKIAHKLNGMKLPTASGKEWTVSTLQGMLHNPAYIGKTRWNARPTKKKLLSGRIVKQRPREKPENWILADGLQRPLIDLKTWEAVRRKLNDHLSHPCPKDRAVANPLAGLVLCGKCGRRMVRRPYANSRYPDVLMCPAASCDNVSSALESVESRILEALRDWLAQYKLTYAQGKSTESEEQTGIKKKALHLAQTELKKLEKQRDSIHDLLEQGVYSADTFLERSKGINNKIEEIKKSIRQLEHEIPLTEETAQKRKEGIPNAEQVLAQYDQANTPTEKNRLLKSLIAKVVYTKTVNGRWHGNPDDFELILYPKLPGPNNTDKNVERKNPHHILISDNVPTHSDLSRASSEETVKKRIRPTEIPCSLRINIVTVVFISVGRYNVEENSGQNQPGRKHTEAMNFYFAPMEGLTGYIYRNAHHAFFPGINKYFSPFIAASQCESFKSRELNDILPENNAGIVLIPQLLTNNAKDFIRASKRIKSLGYHEINFNLGCPSKTVVTKKKGAGFLSDPVKLNAFLDEVFSQSETEISVKTRIGMYQPDEFYELMELFNQYPIKELIIHPRTQKDYYANKPNLKIFKDALTLSKNPVCYNGDIFTVKDYQEFTAGFPEVETLMLGRGLITNPGLVSDILNHTKLEKKLLREFHDRIYKDYQKVLFGDRNVLFKMKELWSHMILLFTDHESYAKKIRKSQRLYEYEEAVASLFREQTMIDMENNHLEA